MTRHPLSHTMARAQAAGDALRALVTRSAVEPDLPMQAALDLAVALDAVQRAVAPLAKQRDAGLRMNAQRLVAALDDRADTPGQIRRGHTVSFLGASDLQATWRDAEDPRPHCRVGEMYEVAHVDQGDSMTLLWLVGLGDRAFNSVCFQRVG